MTIGDEPGNATAEDNEADYNNLNQIVETSTNDNTNNTSITGTTVSGTATSFTNAPSTNAPGTTNVSSTANVAGATKISGATKGSSTATNTAGIGSSGAPNSSSSITSGTVSQQTTTTSQSNASTKPTTKKTAGGFFGFLQNFLTRFGDALSRNLPQQFTETTKILTSSSPFSFSDFAQQHLLDLLDKGGCAVAVKVVVVTMLTDRVDVKLLVADASVNLFDRLADARLVRSALELFVTTVDDLATGDLGLSNLFLIAFYYALLTPSCRCAYI